MIVIPTNTVCSLPNFAFGIPVDQNPEVNPSQNEPFHACKDHRNNCILLVHLLAGDRQRGGGAAKKPEALRC